MLYSNTYDSLVIQPAVKQYQAVLGVSDAHEHDIKERESCFAKMTRELEPCDRQPSLMYQVIRLRF